MLYIVACSLAIFSSMGDRFDDDEQVSEPVRAADAENSSQLQGTSLTSFRSPLQAQSLASGASASGVHSLCSVSPRAELPLSPSFLHSLATLPPLSPQVSPTVSAEGSIASADLGSGEREPPLYVACPCQSVVGHSVGQLTPRKAVAAASALAAAGRPSIPPSISHILSSISAAQSTPTPSALSPPAPSFSPLSVRQIVDYLESLCHHLSETHTTLIRYLQHARHAQLLLPSDPLLMRLEQSNLQLVNALKQLRLDEDAARGRMREAQDTIEGGRRTQALSLSRLPTFMQGEKRRLDDIERARAALAEEQRRVDALLEQRARTQQQLMAVSGVAGELRESGKVKYDVALDGLSSDGMRELLGDAEVDDGLARLRIIKGWREQEDTAAAKLSQVARMEREMRDRLDQLIVYFYK